MSDPKPETAPVIEPKKPEYEILWYPDSRLIADNAPITEYTPEMAERVKEMFTLMYKTDGIGLAAPQIGWNVQLFVVNITPKDKTKERVYWNPKIFNTGDQILDMEGCLSFPTVQAKIRRYETTELTAQTPEGEVTEYFDGLGARAIQHEMDHLEGLLFINRMTPADQKKNAFVLKQLRYRQAAILGQHKKK